MVTPLILTTDSRDDGSLVLRATGELDLSNIDAFSEALASARKEGQDNQLSVDLSGVDYLDSGAISVLFDHAAGIQIVVNPILMSVLTISGLTKVATVKPASQI
jgi:anti-anti-sigma factor